MEKAFLRKTLTLALLGFTACATTIATAAVPEFKTRSEPARYIIVLEEPALVDRLKALQGGQALTLQASGSGGPRDRLTFDSPTAFAQLQDIDDQFAQFKADVQSTLGFELNPVHRYRVGLNGFSGQFTKQEILRLAKMPGVRSIELNHTIKLETDAGPRWIGAERVWDGFGPLVENRGEGVVVGVIDSGINWEHPSFADPGEGLPANVGAGYDHENPYGSQLGLCSDAEVLCNDKLVGVYDFVEDDPGTEVVEEGNNGRDNGAHGAHTAGTAAGNPVSFVISNTPRTASGVAPNANVISYRVCYAGDPDDAEDDACQFDAILAAIDQAIDDGVDVINYSVGGSAFDPWRNPSSILFLSAVEAGIFVATSAGNSGRSGAETIGQPANAPWITAVGAATHDRVLGSALIQSLSGGDTTPPPTLNGRSSNPDGLATTDIVYAGDFGNALCGVGEAELEASCDANTGSTNPFAPGTFNGEIVVCDRGTYGRVEKGKNLLLAGAGGYILANTDDAGEQVNADNHCLPSAHIGDSDGDELRTWLASGSGHRASLSGGGLRTDSDAGDVVADFSSRGPNTDTAVDILKPNVIAPGVDIIAADNESTGFIILGGTSMASPHVAGSAALMIADDPTLTPAQIASRLELTATDAQATTDQTGPDVPATRFDTGAGRVKVNDAILMPLYLDETAQAFRDANPSNNGEPSTLNLASMTDASCVETCSFTRVVGALEAGDTWTVSTSEFPDTVEVTVTPESFVANTSSPQTIEVTVTLNGVADGQWAFGKILLENASYPQAAMPVSVRSTAGDLPTEFSITASESSGLRDFGVAGLAAVDQLALSTGGLQVPETLVFDLVEDPTFSDPFDGSAGSITYLATVPADALWLFADTPASDSEDVDLYVGFDSNGDGVAQDTEIVCFSADFDETETCNVFTPEEGVWWIVVQNFDDGIADASPAQEITLITTVVSASADSDLIATGPGIVDTGESFNLRLAWEDVNEPEGSLLLGAVALGSSTALPTDLGVVPVRLERQSVAAPGTTALLPGRERAFALAGNDSHEALFIDVPPGVDSLDVRVAGATVSQNNGLSLELVRAPFDSAFANAPSASVPDGTSPSGSADGSGGQGPRVTIDGGVTPGRWYAVVSNRNGDTSSVRVLAELTHSGAPVNVFGGLWQPVSRSGINQGFEYTPAGGNRAFLWYSYDEDGSPVWYIASAPNVDNNSWTSDLFRFTNDGENQFGARVGEVGITMIDESDAVFSWTLFGVSGSDRVEPLSRSCPESVSPTQSFSGLWYRGTDGLGGASIIANRNSQAHIHYLYDGDGMPRWLLAAGAFEDEVLPMSQFSGFCPTCTGTVTSEVVGAVGVSYGDNATGIWDLDYIFEDPAEGSMQRVDSILRLSNELSCAE